MHWGSMDNGLASQARRFDSLCQGYVTQDRRKAHVVEADKKLAELLANRPEQDGGAEPLEAEREDEEGEPMLGDLGKAEEYQNLIEVISPFCSASPAWHLQAKSGRVL